MRKEFVKYLLEWLSADTISKMISDLPLKEVDKEILLFCYVKYKNKRGWQKQCAYDLGVDVKTVSKRYNNALKLSLTSVMSYVSAHLRHP